jgi:hypothetical protein
VAFVEHVVIRVNDGRRTIQGMRASIDPGTAALLPMMTTQRQR